MKKTILKTLRVVIVTITAMLALDLLLILKITFPVVLLLTKLQDQLKAVTKVLQENKLLQEPLLGNLVMFLLALNQLVMPLDVKLLKVREKLTDLKEINPLLVDNLKIILQVKTIEFLKALTQPDLMLVEITLHKLLKNKLLIDLITSKDHNKLDNQKLKLRDQSNLEEPIQKLHNKALKLLHQEKTLLTNHF